VLGIQGTLKTSATLAVTAPVVIMTLPMFDIAAAIIRRRLTGRRFDSPDRLHIHHRLLDRGWTPWQVLCLLGALCLTMGGAATAATIFRRDALAWIAAMSLIVLMIRLRLFGHDEFALLKNAVANFLERRFGFLRWLAWKREDSGFEVRGSEVRGQGAEVEVFMRDAPAANLPLWDLFLQNLREWDVSKAEFRLSPEDQPRLLQWINPASHGDERYGWSLAVSLPDRNGDLCELSIAGVDPRTKEMHLAAMTSLLKTFGSYFALHADSVFGLPAVEEKPADIDQRPQRKAA
jgi:hypothetical protein